MNKIRDECPSAQAQWLTPHSPAPTLLSHLVQAASSRVLCLSFPVSPLTASGPSPAGRTGGTGASTSPLEFLRCLTRG